jgi:hypothetical protein
MLLDRWTAGLRDRTTLIMERDEVVVKDCSALKDFPALKDFSALKDFPAPKDFPALKDFPAPKDFPALKDFPRELVPDHLSAGQFLCLQLMMEEYSDLDFIEELAYMMAVKDNALATIT